MKLTDAACRNAKPKAAQYRLGDGRGLFLVVSPGGAKSWRWFYWDADAQKSKGHTIGPYPQPWGIAAARAERDRLMEAKRKGLDPAKQKRIAKHEEARKVEAIEKRERSSFAAIADEWVDSSAAGWTPRHHAQVVQCLRDHLTPQIGAKPVAEILPGDVLESLAPLLAEGKAETARRAYQRLSSVLEYAAMHGHAQFNAAASCKREFGKRLRAVLRSNPRGHFPCIELAELPALMGAIRALQTDTTAKALTLFVAMVGCRTGEARAAAWDEIDWKAKRWNIPATRMKARRPHYFDLAPEALALLKAQREKVAERCPYIFPHPTRHDRHASENAILVTLAAAGFAGRMTGHGFRSLLSTAANESGLHRREVIETHLAHQVGSAVERAYNRAAFEDERRKLAHWWARRINGAHRR